MHEKSDNNNHNDRDITGFRGNNEISSLSRNMSEKISVAIDLRADYRFIFPKFEQFQPDTIKCVFASRISPKKNLIFLLDVLSEVSREVHLEIWGDIDDLSYWNACESKKVEGNPAAEAIW